MGIIVGQLKFPLGDYAQSLREITDPAHELLGTLLFRDIYYELNATYQELFPDGYILTSFIPINPEPFLLNQDYVQFPAIALWREETKTNYFSISRRQCITNWKGLYIYGNLELEDEIKLIGMNNAICARINKVLDTLKSDGYENGISQRTQLGFSRLDTGSIRKSVLKINSNNSLIRYPTIEFEFQTMEILDYYNDIINPLHTIDISINDGDGYNIVDGYFHL